MPPPVTWASARTSQRRPQRAHVVQVEPVRREQQVGVEGLVAEQAADEREAVRVQARGGQPEHDVAAARSATRRSAPLARTSPTHVPAKSSSPSR